MGVLFYQGDGLIEVKLVPKFAIVFRFFITTLVFILWMVKPLVAQSSGNGKIDFSANGEKLSYVLLRLSDDSELNFSYNAGDSIFSKKINYSANDKQPLFILDELLSGSGHTFKMIGNQVVIYRDASLVKKPLQELASEPLSDNLVIPKNVVVAHTNDEILKVMPMVDTIFVRDTIIKFQTDTVFIIDTIVIEKEKPIKPPPSKIKDIPVDYFNQEASREKGWSLHGFVAPVISDFSLVRQDKKFTVRNFSLGIELSKIYNKWNVSGGIKLTHFAEKFNHNFSISDGGYYVTDTIDEYYTVDFNDTTYYYVTDSTWKPIDNQEYNYNINNRIGMIELMASVSFDFYTNSNLRLYVKGGAQLGILIYKTGLAIPDLNQPTGVDFADLNFNAQSVSVLAGIGMKNRINRYFDFNSEIYYFRHLNNIVTNYPTSTKIDGVGLKLGLIYYF